MAINLPQDGQLVKEYDIEQTNEINAMTNIEATNLSLLNSWTTNSNWSTPKCKKIGNIIYIQGYITGGSTGRANGVATLPNGFRPPKYIKFLVAPNTIVQVDTNGLVWVEAGQTTNVFLNGISFFIED